MRKSLGATLLAVGAAVATAGALAWGLDVKITLTPEMIRVLAFKIPLAAGAGLMIFGAVLRRQGLSAERRGAESLGRDDVPQLPAGDPSAMRPPMDANAERVREPRREPRRGPGA